MRVVLAAKGIGVCCLLLLLRFHPAAAQATAIDPATPGPFTPNYTEYQLPAKCDKEVTPDCDPNSGFYSPTELWARVWYPTGKKVPQTLPLVVMLHGQHGTCGHLDASGKWYIDDAIDYTTTGQCPDHVINGKNVPFRVTPNHWGYDYIGRLLATNGYLVVSINVNRGINEAIEGDPADPDPGLILRRARMILRHIQTLGMWNNNGGKAEDGFQFKGRVDFSRISLLGHSRGAEAVAMTNILFNADNSPWPARLPSNTHFVAIAAIAPSDFQTSTNPAGTYGVAYGVLLPMCDGDIIRLLGVKYYDSAVSFVADTPGNFKATFATWAADHDGYNTEWHTQDSYTLGPPGTDKPGALNCPKQGTKLFPTPIGTSAQQQQLGARFAMGVIRAGTESLDWGEVLNPAYQLPDLIAPITEIDRGYFPGAKTAKNLLQFTGNGQCKTELFVTVGTAASCGHPPEHDINLIWIARVRWGAPAGSTPDDNNFAHFVFNGPVDISKMKSLEMRLGPDCVLAQPNNGADYGCSGQSLQGAGTPGSQQVYALLQDVNGNFSGYVDLSQYTVVRQAVGLNEQPVNGATLINPLYHAILSSVRIPISDLQPLQPFDLKNVAGMWVFLGPQDSSGGLFFGDIDASTDVVPSSQARSASALPLPRQGLVLVPARLPLKPDVVVGTAAIAAARPADPGNAILGAKHINAVAIGATDAARTEAMVEFTLRTPGPLIENDSGFFLRIGGHTVPARRTGMTLEEPALTTIVAPASVVENAPAGSTVALVSGGAQWQFGSLNAVEIR